MAACAALGVAGCVTEAFAASVPGTAARSAAAAQVSQNVAYACAGPDATATYTFPITLTGPTEAATVQAPYTVAWGVGTPAAAPTLVAPSSIEASAASLSGEIIWTTPPDAGTATTPTATATATGPVNTESIPSGDPLVLPSMTLVVTPTTAATLNLTTGSFTVNLRPSGVSCSPVPEAALATLPVTISPSASTSATDSSSSTPTPTATVTATVTATESVAATATATATATAVATTTATATVTAPAVTTTSTVQVRVTPVGAAQTGEAPDPGASGAGWMIFGSLMLAGTALGRLLARRAR